MVKPVKRKEHEAFDKRLNSLLETSTMEHGGEAELASAERESYLGLARIGLAQLDFDACQSDHREVSDKVTTRLQSIFRLEGCLRLDSENFISAVITESEFARSLHASNLTAASLCQQNDGSIPLLRVDTVRCLHGMHRVIAAKGHLDLNDQWWTVRLYAAERLSPLISRRIAEGYPNAQSFTDGEIFWKIRTYHRANDERAERKWLARLTTTKQKELRALLRDPRFARAFDNLIDIPGLWRPIQLGALHRLLTINCEDEMLTYLRHIYEVWTRILINIPASTADALTVTGLQGLAPATSSADADAITHLLNAGSIFPALGGEDLRQTVSQNLSSITCMIPSLWIFFEHLKHLEPCSKVLRHLLHAGDRRAIRDALYGAWFDPGQCVIFTTEHTGLAWSTLTDARWLAYLQLWLFAMRHWPQMTEFDPRKEVGQEKPHYRMDPALYPKLGRLAVLLGFRTPEALELAAQDPDDARARQCLDDIGLVELRSDARFVRPISQLLKRANEATAAEMVSSPDLGELVTQAGLVQPIDRRCGRPFEADFQLSRRFLFLPSLCGEASTSGNHVTPFFCYRDLLRSVFGLPEPSTFSAPGQDLYRAADNPDPLSMDLETTNDSLALELQRLRAEQATTEAENRQLRDHVHEIQRQHEEMQSDYDRIDGENRELARTHEELTQELTIVQENFQISSQLFTQDATDLDRLGAQSRELQDEINSLREETASLYREKEQAIRMKNIADDDVIALRTAVEHWKHKFELRDGDVASQKEGLVNLVDALKGDVAKYKEAFQTQKLENEKLAKNNEDLSSQVTLCQSQAIGWELERDRLGEQMQSRAEDIAELTRKVRDLEANAKQSDESNTEQQVVLQRQFDEIYTAGQSAYDEAEGLKSERARLYQEGHEMHALLQQQDETIQLLRNEGNQSNAALVNLRTQVFSEGQDLYSQIQALNTGLERSRETVAKLGQERDLLKELLDGEGIPESGTQTFTHGSQTLGSGGLTLIYYSRQSDGTLERQRKDFPTGNAAAVKRLLKMAQLRIESRIEILVGWKGELYTLPPRSPPDASDNDYSVQITVHILRSWDSLQVCCMCSPPECAPQARNRLWEEVRGTKRKAAHSSSSTSRNSGRIIRPKLITKASRMQYLALTRPATLLRLEELSQTTKAAMAVRPSEMLVPLEIPLQATRAIMAPPRTATPMQVDDHSHVPRAIMPPSRPATPTQESTSYGNTRPHASFYDLREDEVSDAPTVTDVGVQPYNQAQSMHLPHDRELVHERQPTWFDRSVADSSSAIDTEGIIDAYIYEDDALTHEKAELNLFD